MKKIVFSFLCAILAFTLTAEDQVDLDKQLAELEKERARLQTLLISSAEMRSATISMPQNWQGRS